MSDFVFDSFFLAQKRDKVKKPDFLYLLSFLVDVYKKTYQYLNALLPLQLWLQDKCRAKKWIRVKNLIERCFFLYDFLCGKKSKKRLPKKLPRHQRDTWKWQRYLQDKTKFQLHFQILHQDFGIS